MTQQYCGANQIRYLEALSQSGTRHDNRKEHAQPRYMNTKLSSLVRTIFLEDEDEILEDLLPKNISTQIYKAFLENAASEQGSRMTAMDNATRNAGDLVDKLTINYNRSRQASITKELIEIISGAESL